MENVFAHLLYTNVLKKIGKNNLSDSNIKLLSFTSVVPHLSVCLITWDENMHQEKSVSESGLFLTLSLGTSSARNENLRPLLNRNIPLISGKYDLRKYI